MLSKILNIESGDCSGSRKYGKDIQNGWENGFDGYIIVIRKTDVM